MSEDTSKTTHWQCDCGWLVSDSKHKKYKSAQVDLQCSGCGEYKWSTFRSVHIMGTGDAGRKIGE